MICSTRDEQVKLTTSLLPIDSKYTLYYCSKSQKFSILCKGIKKDEKFLGDTAMFVYKQGKKYVLDFIKVELVTTYKNGFLLTFSMFDLSNTAIYVFELNFNTDSNEFKRFETIRVLCPPLSFINLNSFTFKKVKERQGYYNFLNKEYIIVDEGLDKTEFRVFKISPLLGFSLLYKKPFLKVFRYKDDYLEHDMLKWCPVITKDGVAISFIVPYATVTNYIYCIYTNLAYNIDDCTEHATNFIEYSDKVPLFMIPQVSIEDTSTIERINVFWGNREEKKPFSDLIKGLGERYDKFYELVRHGYNSIIARQWVNSSYSGMTGFRQDDRGIFICNLDSSGKKQTATLLLKNSQKMGASWAPLYDLIEQVKTKRTNLYKEMIRAGGILPNLGVGSLLISLRNESMTAINKSCGTTFDRKSKIRLSLQYIDKPRLVKVILSDGEQIAKFNVRRELWDNAFVNKAKVKKVIRTNEALNIIRQSSIAKQLERR